MIIMKILGKEEMLVKLAEQFKTKILVSKPRYYRYVNVLNMNKACFTYEKLIDTFIYASDDDLDQSLRLEDTNVAKIYIKPTALEFSARKLNDLKRCIEIYSQLNNTYFSIPYSDHSSYSEIIEFVKKLKPKRIVPIVAELKDKNTIITDTSELVQYLNKEDLIDSSLKFKLLLTSKTLVSSMPYFRMPKNHIELEEIETKSKISPYLRPRSKLTGRFQKKSIKKKTNEIKYESSPEKNESKINTQKKVSQLYRFKDFD